MSRGRGLKVEIEGLDELLAGTANGYRLLDEVMRDILRGPLGREMARDLKARLPGHIRTGWTISQVGVEDRGAGGVEVGITSRRGDDKHPRSPRANARSIGVWLESGARMHLIPTRVSRQTRLAFNGRVVSRVSHPGMRGGRHMQTMLRVFKPDATELTVRELERRLAPKIGVS